MNDTRNKIQMFCDKHPIILPIICACIGIFLLWGSLSNWSLLFGNTNNANYSMGKIEGLVNIFGRNTARVIVGILATFIIIIGIMGIVGIIAMANET